MKEPQSLADIIAQSEAFEKARQAWLERKNAKPEPTELEKEYAKRVFSPPQVVDIDEFQAATLFMNAAPDNYEIKDKAIYRDLVNYFFGLPTSLNTNKGICIIGGIGGGKTTFMRSIQKAMFSAKMGSFRLFSCVEIEQNIRQAAAVENSAADYSYYDNGYACFDDFGAENHESVIFGNRVIVMAEIVQRRYNRFQAQGVKTHFTTNLSAAEMRARYGDRVFDRMKEMCNIVLFNWESFRK